MRRFIFPLLGVVAILALGAIPAASASKGHARPHIVRCGTLYTPACKKPTIVVHSKVVCEHTGTTIHFPISLHGNAGLRKVVIKVGGRTITTKKFKGGPVNRSLVVAVNTRGSKPGLFTLTVAITDVRGKTVTRTAHFTICKPKPPVFTG
jgi:hypothetical protein